MKDFFSSIMAISRRQQRALLAQQSSVEQVRALQALVQNAREPVSMPQVFYQGVAGAYAEEAAALFLGKRPSAAAPPPGAAFFELLVAGKADYIVVPIENNSTGSISAVYDLLAEYGAYVVGEQTVKVEHCLCALPGTVLEDVTDVYSHEQGFFQSEDFLTRHEGWKQNAVLNTAAAAQLVAVSGVKTKRRSAAAGRHSSSGWKCCKSISTPARIIIHAFVVAPTMELRPECGKLSLMFTLPHEPGTLNNVLGILAAHQMNMLRLESRPMPGEGWRYRFVDVEGDLRSDALNTVLFELVENTPDAADSGQLPQRGPER